MLRKPHAEAIKRIKEKHTPELTYQKAVLRVVRRIPYGKVASYGQIARITGGGTSARMVGYALAANHGKEDVPWQRVINVKGKISLTGPDGALQRILLEDEGVQFSPQGNIDWDKFGWDGQG